MLCCVWLHFVFIMLLCAGGCYVCVCDGLVAHVLLYFVRMLC